MANQIAASFAALQRPDLASLFGSSTMTRNSPQNGVQYFGNLNILPQPQRYDNLGGRINTASSQAMNYQPIQFESSAGTSNPTSTSSQKINLQSQKSDFSNMRANNAAPSQSVNLQPQGTSVYQRVDSQPRQSPSNYISSFSTTVPMTNFGSSSSNLVSNKQNPGVKMNIVI